MLKEILIKMLKRKRLIFNIIVVVLICNLVFCKFTEKVSVFGKISTMWYLKKYDGKFKVLGDDIGQISLDGGRYERYIYDKKNGVEFCIAYDMDMFGIVILGISNDTYYEALLLKEVNEEFKQFFDENHYDREFEIVWDENRVGQVGEHTTIYDTNFRAAFYLYSESKDDDAFVEELEKNVNMEISN